VIPGESQGISAFLKKEKRGEFFTFFSYYATMEERYELLFLEK